MTTNSVTAVLHAWRALVIILGIGHALVGVALIVGGPAGLAGPVFERSNNIPWWAWGIWALIAGALIIFTRTTIIGLAATAAWYALWAALLITGLLDVGGPYYPIPVYLLLTALHILVLVVERATRQVRHD